MTKTNELITLTRIDETTVYVNINHIAAFYHNKAWEYTIVILSDGTQLDIKDSVESIAEYFQLKGIAQMKSLCYTQYISDEGG